MSLGPCVFASHDTFRTRPSDFVVAVSLLSLTGHARFLQGRSSKLQVLYLLLLLFQV